MVVFDCLVPTVFKECQRLCFQPSENELDNVCFGPDSHSTWNAGALFGCVLHDYELMPHSK